jgi:hypothetical protein
LAQNLEKTLIINGKLQKYVRAIAHVSSAVNGKYKIHGNEIKGAVPWHSDEAYSDLIKSMKRIPYR